MTGMVLMLKTGGPLMFAIIISEYVFDSPLDCRDHLRCHVMSDSLIIIFGLHMCATAGCTATAYTLLARINGTALLIVLYFSR